MDNMKITIDDDFNLEKIAESGQCFRIFSFPDGTWRFISCGKILYIRQAGDHIYEVSEWNPFWQRYFDLDRSYSRIRESINGDNEYLVHAACAGAGIRILRQDPWETLISFIISQRKTIPAISSSIEKICRFCGTPLTTSRETVCTFPSPEAILATPEKLNRCSLGYRLPYVRAAAEKIADGSISLEKLDTCNDETLMKELLSFYGVGRKVASCVCLFAYGRSAMAPVDTWIQKVINSHFGGQNPFPGYGANAGILQQYLFYYARMEKGRLNRNRKK